MLTVLCSSCAIETVATRFNAGDINKDELFPERDKVGASLGVALKNRKKSERASKRPAAAALKEEAGAEAKSKARKRVTFKQPPAKKNDGEPPMPTKRPACEEAGQRAANADKEADPDPNESDVCSDMDELPMGMLDQAEQFLENER